MKDIRPWTYAALFGALWGVLESTLGTILKVIPWIPSGTVMAAIGVVCLVTSRRLARTVGCTLATGTAAALVMIFTLGGLRPGSLVAVILEATLLELAMTAAGSRWVGAVTGGFFALAVTPLQKVLVVVLVAGPEAARAYTDVAVNALQYAGLGQHGPAVLVTCIVLVAGTAGAGVAAWSWRLAGRVARRLGDTA